jgi:hypothetical protein
MLVQKLDAKTTPQWQPIGIAVTVLLFIGGALITSAIKEALTKNEAAIEIMRRENEARIVKLWDAENANGARSLISQGAVAPAAVR